MTVTDIRLDTPYFDYDAVEKLLIISRRVARHYGARRTTVPLRLLTSSAADLPSHLTTDTDIEAALAGHDGMCWPNGGYVWLRRHDVPTYEAQILAHEFAHLVTYRRDRIHGAEWRRMYMRIVGLWQYYLTGTFPNYITLAHEVIKKYAIFEGPNMKHRAVELTALVDAAEATWEEFSGQMLQLLGET